MKVIYNNLIIHREKIDIYKLAEQWEKNKIQFAHCMTQSIQYCYNTFNAPYVFYYRGIAND